MKILITKKNHAVLMGTITFIKDSQGFAKQCL